MRWLALLAALALCARAMAAQDTARRVVVTDLGPGASGRILRDALARPHRLVDGDTVAFILPRGETERLSLIVLHRDTYVGGKVEGDVIVVGGDLFVRAGAEIGGRAIAIGGGVYPSSLGYVAGGIQTFRDETFEVQFGTDGYRLIYRSLREGSEPPLLFPGVYGLRVPTYDRVNGLSLPFGPALTFAGGRGEANAIATYRSDIGKIDPKITADVRLGRRTRLAAGAERGSFTNDAWIYPDLINSGATLVFGEDTRNWYRADRGELTIHRLWEMTRTTLEPFIGARYEKSSPIGPTVGDTRGPWSVFGRGDALGMLRPNPQVTPYNIPSWLAGTTVRWEAEELQIRARSQLEISRGPTNVPADGFSQATSDLDVRFPTFGEQSYRMEAHWVTSLGTVPFQRFAYLGGPGTMPFLDILEQGGSDLLLVDQRYSIPLPRYTLGFMGSPTLQLRHRLGGAGVSELPALEHMIGVGVSLTVIRGEIRLDPASGRVKFTTGFTFAR